MNPRIVGVVAEKNHILVLSFSNGECRRFDLSPYLHYPVFQPLADEDFFKLAQADHGTVCWSRDIDFDPDTLYLESSPAVS
jgi:hypothetical protein